MQSRQEAGFCAARPVAAIHARLSRRLFHRQTAQRCATEISQSLSQPRVVHTRVGQTRHLFRPHACGIYDIGQNAEGIDRDPLGLSQPDESVSHHDRSAQDGFRERQLRSESGCASRAMFRLGTLPEGTVCVLLARGSACGVQPGDSERCGPQLPTDGFSGEECEVSREQLIRDQGSGTSKQSVSFRTSRDATSEESQVVVVHYRLL